MSMRHRAFVVSGLIALAGCPSRESTERKFEAAMERFRAFTDQMCACKDRACADKVSEAMTTWAQEMAATQDSKFRPSEAMTKKMSDLGQRYAECMTKLMDPPVPPPPPRDDIPPPTATRDADTLLRGVRSWASATQPEHRATDLHLAFVDAKGELDGEYGEIRIVFGRAGGPADDPKRKTGAPVVAKPPATDCFELAWTAKTKAWERSIAMCTEGHDAGVRCTVPQIWARAIEKQAPADALATIDLRSSAAGWSWTFAIQDEPRRVDVQESFADDCPLAVEK